MLALAPKILFYSFNIKSFIFNVTSQTPLNVIMTLSILKSVWRCPLKYAKECKVHSVLLTSPHNPCIIAIVQRNPGKGITKYQFLGLFKEAWMEAIRPSNICAGFRKCGIFPFDPKAIECTASAPKMATTSTTSAELNDGKNF